ncbi:hypothetical protein [Streptomyces katrae]|uniref:hypothetical protein n=1 Tax=Streptomyces katrae TaxID=68223 RepID=UPI0004C20491|nr:hypothetical protein [Streptomyces katrae]
MTRTEIVLSAALCDPKAIPQLGAPLVRALGLVPVDPDFADTVEAGYVESPDEWIARTGGVRAALATVDPADPDAEPKRAALRREICLARGVDPADICPVMGYDLSDSAFTRVRDGWAEHLKAHRPSDWTYAAHDKARAFWAKARPDLIADWPEAVR